MNKEEFKDFERQVYENQESAIKLLERNVELNKKLEELEGVIEEQEYTINCLKKEIKNLQDKKEEDFDPYSEYGVSERDFI